MKTSLHFGLLAALAVSACNAPNNALFDDSPGGGGTAQNQGGTGSNEPGGGSGADAATGAMPTTIGGSSSQAEAGSTNGANGGAVATAGTASGGTGNDMTPDPSLGGAPDGAAGSSEPEKPVEPVCGNGKIEAGEECDDGGHAGPDGCSEQCKVVCADRGPGTLKSADFHCYNGYDEATFTGAVAACEARGAHIASISSAEENKIARMFVNDGKWIGGFEDVALTAEGDGDYGWYTSEPFTYTNWSKGEPNQLEYRCEGGGFNARCYEHCIAILGDGTWADRRCDTPDGYVCEWEPPVATTK